MESADVTIVNLTGLHARPASVFVKAANKFKSNITIISGGKNINAKSIIKVMSTALVQGTDITIQADGEDEVEAVDTLVKLIKSGFGEM